MISYRLSTLASWGRSIQAKAEEIDESLGVSVKAKAVDQSLREKASEASQSVAENETVQSGVRTVSEGMSNLGRTISGFFGGGGDGNAAPAPSGEQ